MTLNLVEICPVKSEIRISQQLTFQNNVESLFKVGIKDTRITYMLFLCLCVFIVNLEQNSYLGLEFEQVNPG